MGRWATPREMDEPLVAEDFVIIGGELQYRPQPREGVPCEAPGGDGREVAPEPVNGNGVRP
jgi:hypothetical protein